MGTKSKRKKGKKSIFAVVIVIAAVIIACAAGFYIYVNSAGGPLESGSSAQVSVEIPSGSATGAIGSILEQNGLIDSASVFKMKTKLLGYDGKFKAGQYTLSPGMTMEEMMDILIEGKSNTLRFTIPEGYDIAKVTARLTEKNLIDPTAFAEELENGSFDYKFLKDAPTGANRLEGYLYPETYDVYATATAHDIIDKMLSQFNKVFKDEYYDRANELNHDINEVLTIASIIEREAVEPEDMKLISSVIYNRLKIDMPLQVDATIQYARGSQTDRVTNKDLEVSSPYNTYKNKGLPPGPICSPSVLAIEAALYPEETDYLYFVATGTDGKHVFTDDYQQFLKDKKKYIQNAFGQ